MSKKAPALLIGAVVVALASAIALARPDGGSNPTGYTSLNGRTCTSCHSGTPNSGPGKVTIQAPATAAPGSVVPVTISLSSLQKPNGNGFQMAAYDSKFAVQSGWIMVDSSTVLKSNFLNHTKAGQARQSWRAFFRTPSTATNLQLFASGLDGNDDGDDKGDRTYTTSVKMTAANVALSMTAPPKLGTAVPMTLNSPGDAGKTYVLASSFGNSGIPMPGKRSIPLALDALTILTVQNLVPSVFKNYQGTLNGSGVATATLALPGTSALTGQTIYSAFIVVDQKGPGGIGTISNGLEMRLY